MLFNLARLKYTRIRDTLLADDAVVASHTQQELLPLMNCKAFGLTISLKKANIMRHDAESPPVITIDDYELDAVCQFTYLSSTTTDNLPQRSTRLLERQLQFSLVSRIEC